MDELEVSRFITQELVEDLHKRGQIDLRDAFMDGSFPPEKKGGLLSARQIMLREMKQKYGLFSTLTFLMKEILDQGLSQSPALIFTFEGRTI